MRDNLLLAPAATASGPAAPGLSFQTWYPALGAKAAKVRQDLVGTLSSWDLAPLADDVVLVVSELFGNAVRHTSRCDALRVDAIVVRGEDDCVYLRIGVTDTGGDTLDKVRPPSEVDFDSESGRGLLLVEELSDHWGAEPCKTGKTVWADFDVSRAA